ncbi:MAG: hypothetical protein ILP04_01775 [Bacteroidales bacterium]|nr:hypothetical protein [Bacteroidales bacterium]
MYSAHSPKQLQQLQQLQRSVSEEATGFFGEEGLQHRERHDHLPHRVASCGPDYPAAVGIITNNANKPKTKNLLCRIVSFFACKDVKPSQKMEDITHYFFTGTATRDRRFFCPAPEKPFRDWYPSASSTTIA